MPVTHLFVSPKPDAADPTIVRPSDWNATHAINVLPTEADLTLQWDYTGGLTTTGPILVGIDVVNKAYLDAVIATVTPQRDFAFNMPMRVPGGGGVRYLEIGAVATSAAPLVVLDGSTLFGLTLSVAVVDVARTFDLEVFVNGVLSPAVLSLPLATTKVTSAAFAVALVTGDEIAVRLRRTSGAGASTFRSAIASLHMTVP